MRAFISHNSLDGEWVAHIKRELTAFGVEAYIYEHDPQPGHPVVEKVQAEIRRSDVVIAFLTKNSAHAPFVHQEIGYAARSGKLVIPLIERGLPSDVLAMLQGLEYVVFDLAEPQRGIDDLGVYLRKVGDQRVRDELRLAIGVIVLVMVIAAMSSEGASG